MVHVMETHLLLLHVYFFRLLKYIMVRNWCQWLLQCELFKFVQARASKYGAELERIIRLQDLREW